MCKNFSWKISSVIGTGHPRMTEAPQPRMTPRMTSRTTPKKLHNQPMHQGAAKYQLIQKDKNFYQKWLAFKRV